MNRPQTIERHPAPSQPHMARIHYPRVVLQLLWRMRVDLLVMGLLCLGLNLLRPMDWDDVLMRQGSQSTLGLAVAVFLAFRNTQAINRWWEARSLWGALVNQSRTWRDTLLAVLAPSRNVELQQQRLLQLQVLLVWLVNLELRGYGQRDLRQRVMAMADALGFGPQVTVQEVSKDRSTVVQQLFSSKAISGMGREALLRSIEAFNDALGGLQKIRNTPIPAPYDAFVRLIAWLYGAELFINLNDSGQTVLGASLFLGFLVAERIAAYVEGPFDWDPPSFSLPLNEICLGISADLLAQESPFASVPRCHDHSIWT